LPTNDFKNSISNFLLYIIPIKYAFTSPDVIHAQHQSGKRNENEWKGKKMYHNIVTHSPFIARQKKVSFAVFESRFES
jgi:hypothetical protein